MEYVVQCCTTLCWLVSIVMLYIVPDWIEICKPLVHTQSREKRQLYLIASQSQLFHDDGLPSIRQITAISCVDRRFWRLGIWGGRELAFGVRSTPYSVYCTPYILQYSIPGVIQFPVLPHGLDTL